MVTALTLKLGRDLRRLGVQGLAIALVLAAGVAVLVMSLGMSAALEQTRTAWYDRARLGDVFATAVRLPRAILPEIAALPGVAAAEARATGLIPLELPGQDGLATGRLLSWPETGARLNRPLLRAGHWPDPGATDEVVVSARFAAANGFVPGDRFGATIEGQRRVLRITGTALSPEFVYTIPPGGLMPDDAGFGVIWMPERAAAAALGLRGAANDVTLALAPGQPAAPVIAALDRLLAPYGGTGAVGRADQTSNAFLEAEIAQLRAMTWVLPPVFLGVSAFLVHMVLGRIVRLERGQIGLLKALGYSSGVICLHYLALAAVIALAGIALGWALGLWLSDQLARLYAEFFDFPWLIGGGGPRGPAIAALVGLGAAALGAGQAAWAAARLPPAEAMRPPAPPPYRHGPVDRGMQRLALSQPALMVLRALIRWPLRAGLTTLGLALAVAVLVSAGFFPAALDRIVENAFFQANRQDTTLTLVRPIRADDLPEIARLPGVLRAEGLAHAPVTLQNGLHSRRLALEARAPDALLVRLVDAQGLPVRPVPGGIVLSDRLARALAVGPGDRITLRFHTGRQETQDLPVTGIVTQYFGLGAYVAPETLARLTRTSPQIGGAALLTDPAARGAFEARLRQLPMVAGVTRLDAVRDSFRDTIRRNVTLMTTIYTILGIGITLGVAYNAARVILSERARELASLRILGFSRAEVSGILLAEVLLPALLAQPAGWAIGALVARAMVHGFESDLYAVPLVLEPAAFARASLIVLGTALTAALLVRRRIDRMDLIAVMKTRE